MLTRTQRDAILATPLVTIDLPSTAKAVLHKIAKSHGIVTVGDWYDRTEDELFDIEAIKSLGTLRRVTAACENLGLPRNYIELEYRRQLDAELQAKKQFEDWCWAHEPLIRHLQEDPALVLELEAGINFSPAALAGEAAGMP